MSDEEREWLQGAEGVPEDWLGKLEAAGREGRFNLLGEGERFYQDRDVQGLNRRPVGDLLVEFPTETSVAHFRHNRDGEYGFCPACCALGVVRFCVFANAYAQGRYTAALNGPTPAYAMLRAATLLATLLLNTAADVTMRREPPWLSHDPPTVATLDVPTALAWRSRRVWLGDPTHNGATCSCCGRPGPVVRWMAFTGNWAPPFESSGEKRFWDRDPHLLLEEQTVAPRAGSGADGKLSDDRRGVNRAGRGGSTVSTLGFPSPGSQVTTHARFWRRAGSAWVARARRPLWEEAALGVEVAGPAANKGLYQDAAALLLPPVPAAARAEAGAVLAFMSAAATAVRGVVRKATPNPRQQHQNRIAMLEAWGPAAEVRLRQALDKWLLGSPAGRRSAAGSGGERDSEVANVFSGLARAVVAASTPGSFLRRREAERRALALLDDALRKLAIKATATACAPEPSASETDTGGDDSGDED